MEFKRSFPAKSKAFAWWEHQRKAVKGPRKSGATSEAMQNRPEQNKWERRQGSRH